MNTKNKNSVVNVVSVIFGLIMLGAAYNHIVNAEIYYAMVPKFIPLVFADVFSVVAEGLVGILLLIPKTRKYGAVGFLVLMCLFLPLHIWDIFRVKNLENPLVKNMTVAVVRLVIQFVVIGVGIWMYRIKANIGK